MKSSKWALSILHHLVIPLSHRDGFSKIKNSYIKSAYYSICDNYGVNADEIWMNGDWFYSTACSVLVVVERLHKRSPTVNLTRWINYPI